MRKENIVIFLLFQYLVLCLLHMLEFHHIGLRVWKQLTSLQLEILLHTQPAMTINIPTFLQNLPPTLNACLREIADRKLISRMYILKAKNCHRASNTDCVAVGIAGMVEQSQSLVQTEVSFVDGLDNGGNLETQVDIFDQVNGEVSMSSDILFGIFELNIFHLVLKIWRMLQQFFKAVKELIIFLRHHN